MHHRRDRCRHDPPPTHLASWAGVCPGNNITGGKRRSGTSNKGNRWLGEILNQCADAASHTRDTYLAAQFWRLQRRIGRNKAALAVSHSILVICWHLLTNNCDYRTSAATGSRRTDTDKRRDHLIRQLHNLGYGSPSPKSPDGPTRNSPTASHERDSRQADTLLVSQTIIKALSRATLPEPPDATRTLVALPTFNQGISLPIGVR